MANPIPCAGFLGFGSNLLLAFSDPLRGRRALAALDFYVHADLFMNPDFRPSSMPTSCCRSRRASSARRCASVSRSAPRRNRSCSSASASFQSTQREARPDVDIIFDLAVRLGLGEHFLEWDVEAAYRQQLDAPSGSSLEALRAEPKGIRAPLATRYAKHAELDANGNARGFPTPSRKVEFWSETLQVKGYQPLPDFAPPPTPQSDQVPACAHLRQADAVLARVPAPRALPSLRRSCAMDPEVMLLIRRPRPGAASRLESG